jgi:type III secretory pathway component EscS
VEIFFPLPLPVSCRALQSLNCCQDTIHLFVVLVVSLSLAVTLLQKEWLAGIFISLFFPVKLWPIALILIFMLRWMGIKVKAGRVHGEA